MAMITCPNPGCKRENIFDGGKCPGCGCTPATYAEDSAKANSQNAIKNGTCPECNGKLNEIKVSLGALGSPYQYRVSGLLECPNCGWNMKNERTFTMQCKCGGRLSTVGFKTYESKKDGTYYDFAGGCDNTRCGVHESVKMIQRNIRPESIYVYANKLLDGGTQESGVKVTYLK